MPEREFTAGTDYRYGFNTQEHDKEINKNITTAKFWEYDARLGRRWNIDPITKVGESPYACFGDNPILLTDHNGDTPKDKNKHVSKSENRQRAKYEKMFNRVERQLRKEGVTLPANMPYRAAVQTEMEKRFPKKTERFLEKNVQSQTTDWNRESEVVKGTTTTTTTVLPPVNAPANGNGTNTTTFPLPANTTGVQVVGDNLAIPDRVSVNQTQPRGRNNLFDMGVFAQGQYATGSLPVAPGPGGQVSVTVTSSDGANSAWNYTVTTTQTIVTPTASPIAYPINNYDPK